LSNLSCLQKTLQAVLFADSFALPKTCPFPAFLAVLESLFCLKSTLAMTERPLKILISRLSAHGDVLQTLPLLSRIKSHFPEAQVGWVVEEAAEPLLAGNPLIHQLHVFKKKRWTQQLRSPKTLWAGLKNYFSFVRALRQERYQIGFDPQGLFKSGLMLWWAGIPKRVGFDRTREGASIFYTDTLPHHDLTNADIPTVTLFSEFVRVLGVPVPLRFDAAAQHHELFEFVLPPLTEQSLKKREAWFEGFNPEWPIVALAPETIWPSKHWPTAYWETILKSILNRPLNIVIVGTDKIKVAWDQQIADLTGADAQAQVLNLMGQTSWPDLQAIFSVSMVFIGLDSAPLHLANATGKPYIIGLYGPTSARRTGPIGSQHIAIQTRLNCQPCFKKRCPLSSQTDECMKQLLPERVLEALDTQILRLKTQQVLHLQEPT
jgi:lipopolysaccharide heptosyltransferase II